MASVFRRILRIEAGVSVWQALADHFTGSAITWVIALGGGGTMTYLAAISSWVQPWGPVGWGAIGLFSFLVLVTGSALGSYLRSSAVASRALAKFSEDSSKTTYMNVLSDSFSKQRMRLSDFYHPFFRTKRHAKFTDCEIYGPGSMFAFGAFFDHTSFIECDVVVVNEPISSFTLTAFENCTFERCIFYRVTLFVTKGQAQDMERSIPGHMNIIAGSAAKVPPASSPQLQERKACHTTI